MKRSSLITAAIFFMLGPFSFAQQKDMPVNYKGDAQVEVGSQYVGIEIHHSSPSLERISFYYPVANSIDLSTDYWRRDTSFIMSLGLKTGEGKREQIALKPFEFTLNPYSVSFRKSEAGRRIEVSYQFAATKPAMVVTYTITNTGSKAEAFEFDTHLETSLRTSHTFKLIDKAWTEFDETGSTIYTNFNNPETQNAQIFAANAGEVPVSYYTKGSTRAFENELWFSGPEDTKDKLIPKDNPARPAAKFLYRKTLRPKEKMTVVQIIGSCRQNEGRENVSYMLANYKKEIGLFEKNVLDYVSKIGNFKTGDKIFDHSYNWAKAVLSVNQHYIDGVVRPMPCPAEYNFYFSHDVFLTDLACVNFDLERVKRDLEYTMKLSNKDHIIPHAYYWKDSAYVTEFATPDNWNHFWFIVLSASYLRHSNDTVLLKQLYPYLSKSLSETMKNRKDDIMWAYRPDWWDIGHNYGPRAFMTIMAIKAMKDYAYIFSRLSENTGRLPELENESERMKERLNTRLWDDTLKYLINYFEDGSEDKHYYIGSLPAADFNFLSAEREKELVKTAEEKLLDKKLGIYTVYPMDFNKLIEYLKFAGNEAGDPFLYINGGIWSQGNAFFALGLKSAGRRQDAVDFVRRIMTVDGIMAGPNGQPAMYEYRNGNFHDPAVYGKVDKPQFMWAAGFYIYSLYNLFGISENEWNVSLNPFLGSEKSVNLSLNALGKQFNVTISGKGDYIKSITYNGRNYPSAVIPDGGIEPGKIAITLGNPSKAYLERTDARVTSCSSNGKTLTAELAAFKGHKNETVIVGPSNPKSIELNGKKLEGGYNVENRGGVSEIKISFTHEKGTDQILVRF
ncbi:MAG TPA: hypothetical protein VHO03_14705 [Ignavibacteriales bacterium]|nr:hypothetical protein [Ignavibacteriales bacterium]